MEASCGCRVELALAVVHAVESPQERDEMIPAVPQVHPEVEQDEGRDALDPRGPLDPSEKPEAAEGAAGNARNGQLEDACHDRRIEKCDSEVAAVVTELVPEASVKLFVERQPRLDEPDRGEPHAEHYRLGVHLRCLRALSGLSCRPQRALISSR